jgi:hypothetical protein
MKDDEAYRPSQSESLFLDESIRMEESAPTGACTNEDTRFSPRGDFECLRHIHTFSANADFIANLQIERKLLISVIMLMTTSSRQTSRSRPILSRAFPLHQLSRC